MPTPCQKSIKLYGISMKNQFYKIIAPSISCVCECAKAITFIPSFLIHHFGFDGRLAGCLAMADYKFNSRKSPYCPIVRVQHTKIDYMFSLGFLHLAVVYLLPVNRNCRLLKLIRYHVHISKVHSCIYFML